MSLEEVKINVLTLNCWGIPLVSKNKVDRMNAIAKEISTSSYDIVCLQEVWSENDFIIIKEQAAQNLPYTHYFFSGVIGAGLCILSKYPIVEVFFHQWAVNGYVHKIQHGDWFGGKGVGLCQVRHKGYLINVYNAHLHAEYNQKCDMYRCHRVLQAFDTAQFIRLTSTNADLVILGGDLNTEPIDLPYRIICQYAELDDSGKLDERGTNECDQNSYSNRKVLPNPGKRIDYIMYKTGPHMNISLLTYKLPLPERVPSHSFSYSDHEAILAVFKIDNALATTKPEKQNVIHISKKCEQALKEGIAECVEGMKRLTREKNIYYVWSAILFGVLALIWILDEIHGLRFSNVLRLIITIGMCFTLSMATLWNSIETNATRSGKLGMEMAIAQDIKE